MSDMHSIVHVPVRPVAGLCKAKEAILRLAFNPGSQTPNAYLGAAVLTFIEFLVKILSTRRNKAFLGPSFMYLGPYYFCT